MSDFVAINSNNVFDDDIEIMAQAAVDGIKSNKVKCCCCCECDWRYCLSETW